MVFNDQEVRAETNKLKVKGNFKILHLRQNLNYKTDIGETWLQKKEVEILVDLRINKCQNCEKTKNGNLHFF